MSDQNEVEGLGTDGLTDEERAEYLAAFEAGVGKKPLPPRPFDEILYEALLREFNDEDEAERACSVTLRVMARVSMLDYVMARGGISL